MSIALLIIDMQKKFMKDSRCKDLLNNALEYINETSRLFRQYGHLVFIIQDIEVGEGPGSIEYELIDTVETTDADIFVSKKYSNAFWKTNLETRLKEKNIEFIVLCGFAAEHCVLFTYNGALERGFNASILQYGIAGFDPMTLGHTYSHRAIISYEALEFFLEKNKQ